MGEIPPQIPCANGRWAAFRAEDLARSAHP